jgi:hypothetical protein
VNKDQVPEITGFAVVLERKEEQVQEIVLSGIVVRDQSIEKRKNLEFIEMMSPQTKRNMTLHQRRYYFEPFSLETPNKYDF